MYQGKHGKKRTPMNKKLIVLLSALFLIFTVTAGSTLAYLITSTQSVTNTFTPSTVSVEIVEPGWDNGDSVKENVTIKNTGDTKAYIRAAIVVSWVDSEGNERLAVNGDYSISGKDSGWFKSGDLYYWSSPVDAKDSTGYLFTSCAPNAGKAPEGCTLKVEVLAQAIQAEPASVVADNWGVTVNSNRTISK